ncbi:LemA family protein, partial [Enterococcus faecalis]|uniref:LemA family protein n=1 Tax=Enterococcus faecalis TaxID=1351 RepID=UPI00403FAC27
MTKIVKWAGSALLMLLVLFAASLGLMRAGLFNPSYEDVKARWADVQADYQRRADLIPNLVATVKASVQGEDKVLTDVIGARAKATQVTI